MYITAETTNLAVDHKYHKRLVDYGNRPFINPNFKWMIVCVPVAIVMVLIICLRIRRTRLGPKAVQASQHQAQSELEHTDANPPNQAASELQPDVTQGSRAVGPEIRRSSSFGQMLPLWNARSSSLSPIHSIPPPPAYVRDSPDPPKYEDVIGPDDVPLAHCQSELLSQAG
jgi:hypothetical protein